MMRSLLNLSYGISYLLLFILSSINITYSQNLITQKVWSKYQKKIFPQNLALNFMVFSESEKGNLPIENIESIIRNDLINNQIEPSQMLTSGDYRSAAKNYKTFQIRLFDEQEYKRAFKILKANPYIYQLSLAYSYPSTVQKAGLEQVMVKQVWEVNKYEAKMLSKVQNKHIIGIAHIDATRTFDMAPTEKSDVLTPDYSELYQNELEISYHLTSDTTQRIKLPPTTIQILGSSRTELLPDKSNVRFKLFNNEIQKNKVQLSQIHRNLISSIESYGVPKSNISATLNEYLDQYDVIVYSLNASQLSAIIKYLSTNKNVLNIDILHEPLEYIDDAVYQKLLLDAISDAKTKANLFAKILSKKASNITHINVKEKPIAKPKKDSDFEETLTPEEWQNKCKITLDKIIEVTFTLE